MKALKNLSAEAAGVILSIVVMIASVGATFGITQHQISKHEQKLQDDRRKIRLLDPSFISQFVTEYQSLMGESII